jgi:cytochrome c biogenesis protein CcdA
MRFPDRRFDVKRQGLILLLFALLTLPAGTGTATQPAAETVSSGGPIEVYLFWQHGCPHCERQIELVAELEATEADVRAHFLELGEAANRRLYREVARRLGMTQLSVPLTVIGDMALVGATAGLPLSQSVEGRIAYCRRTGCPDTVASLADTVGLVADREAALAAATAAPGAPSLAPGANPRGYRVPLFGEVDLTTLSLPVLTVLLAAIDGFNPCAMWVLVFLIGLLLGLQDRARRWALGGAFLLTTAVVYYLVIAAWLHTLLAIGLIVWLRVVIGAAAIAGGGYYLWQYFRSPELICHVADASRRQRILDGLRKAALQPRFLAAIGAMVVLAVSVNFIELLCSAGIPAVFTQILALQPMTAWERHAWIGLYVLVFLLDDLAVFALAMLTLERTNASRRYAHHAQLVGGLVLLVVGTLLVVRPEWLSGG